MDILNKMVTFGKICAIKTVLVLIFTLLWIESGVCSEVTETLSQSHSSPVTSNRAKLSLKKCEPEAASLDFFTNGIVELPTFSTQSFRYEMKKYKIDQSSSMTLCPSGKAPKGYNRESTLTKADFDQKIKANDFSNEFLFSEILRSTHLLFENRYLSVGNHTSQTAVYYSTDEFCIESIKGKGKQISMEFRTCPFSKTRPVLQKCCPLGMMLGEESSCVWNNNTAKWDPYYLDAKTRKILSVDEANPVYKSAHIPCDQEWWFSDECSHDFHPVTDNTIAALAASRNWDIFDPGEYWCLETSIMNGRQQMALVQCEEEAPKRPVVALHESYTYMITMYIGAFFHLLTTAVHLLTWRKQNIHGRTLCSCTASLFCMQYFLGTVHLIAILNIPLETPVCIINGIASQYFMIAAFTWLLVVNFDLWKTFGSVRLEGGSSLKRFLVYSMVGWGFPLLISMISISLQFGFKCPISGVPVPDFGTYYCFVAPWAQGLYVYYILMALNIIALTLAVLTIYELIKWKKESVNLRSNKNAGDSQIVLLFLKLTVVMGLTWVFETISWALTKEHENHIGWIIFDLYNSLSAILIFVIFVCKSSTLSLLEQAVPGLAGLTDGFSRLVSKFSGETSSYSTATTGLGNSQDSTEVRYIKQAENNYGSTNK